MTFSATQAALSGFRLIGARPMAIVAWAILYLLAFVVLIGLFIALAGSSYLEMVQVLGQGQVDPAVVARAVGPVMAVVLVMALIGAMLAAIMNAAIFRAVLRPQEGGLAYLRLGGDEIRLFLLAIVVWLLTMLAIGAPMGLTLLLALSTPDAAWVVWVFGILFSLAIGLFLGVRLSLAAPMTFAEHRFQLLESWALTRGRFWPLLGMFLLVALFLILLSIVASVAAAPFQAMLTSQFTPLMADPGLATAERIKDLLARPGPLFIVGVIGYCAVSMVSSVVQQVLMYAPLADAYVQIARPRDPGVSEVFL